MPSLTEAPVTAATTGENPFPGPTPYLRADAGRFFGRGDEIDELTSLVLSTSAVVLDAPSGTGKSSLINAGLIPMLEEYDFKVIAVRFGEHAVAMQRSAYVSGGNPFAAAVVAAIAESTDAVGFDDSLPDAMARLAAGGGSHLLLLDQFEEIFSNYPAHWSDRTPFFRQLAQGLDANRNLRALLAIRSDFLASLSPYQREIPGQLVVRYNLESLRTDAAAEAVDRTFRDAGRPLSRVDIANLIDGLLTIWVGDKRLDVKGEFVNLIQLQIVCRGHWEKLAGRDGDPTVDTAGTSAIVDVDRAMDEFVDAAIANTVRATRCDESVVRQWLESALITPNDRRAVVLVGEGETAGVDNAVVDTLQAERLVASEQRNDERWVELTHDSMIRAIHRSNDRWRRAQRRRRVRWRNWLALAIVVLAGVFVALRHESGGSGRVRQLAARQGDVTAAPEQLSFNADPNQVMLVSADINSFSLDDLQASPPRLLIHPAGDDQTVVAQTTASTEPTRSGTSAMKASFRAPGRGNYTAVLDASGLRGATFDLSVTGVPLTITANEVNGTHDELLTTDEFAVALPAERPISVSVDNADINSITGADVLAQGDTTAIVVGHADNQFAVVDVSSYNSGRLPVRTRVLQDAATLPLDSDHQIDSSQTPAAGSPRETTQANIVQYTIETQADEPVLVGASCSSSVLVAVFDDQGHAVAASGTPRTHELGRSSDTQEAVVVTLPAGKYHAVFATDDYYLDSPLECTIGAQRPGDHTVVAPATTELQVNANSVFDAFLLKSSGDAVVVLDSVRGVSPSLRCGQTGTTTLPGADGRLVGVAPASENCVIVLARLHDTVGDGSSRLRFVDVGGTAGSTS